MKGAYSRINKSTTPIGTVPSQQKKCYYASKPNAEFAEEKSIVNIVFNKVIGRMRNKVRDQNF